MADEFDALSDDQKQAFQGRMAALGFAPDALSHQGTLVTGDREGPTIISADPNESHVPPTIVTVNSIAELKALHGVPDEHYTTRGVADVSVDYPDELPQHRMALTDTAPDICALRDSLQPEERDQIVKAAHAYVLGNSEKVASYEPLINAAMFPTEIALVTIESVVVSPGKPLVFTGPKPISANYGSITVEPGGQIIIEVQTNLTAQRFEAK